MITSGIIPRLAAGYLSIYGYGSIYGFSPSAGITFGKVYASGDIMQTIYQVGQNVLFPYADAHSVSYQGVQYFLVPESKIILVEQQPPAAP